jgi:hypothetical protein
MLIIVFVLLFGSACRAESQYDVRPSDASPQSKPIFPFLFAYILGDGPL